MDVLYKFCVYFCGFQRIYTHIDQYTGDIGQYVGGIGQYVGGIGQYVGGIG